MEHTNPTSKATRRYFWEFGLAMVAYVIVMAISRTFLKEMSMGPGPIALALLPLIPVIFVFAAVVRYVMGTDELQRQIIVNSLALAGGATALLAITYGLLESPLFPPPSVWWTYVVFMVAWLIAAFFVRRHYR